MKNHILLCTLFIGLSACAPDNTPLTENSPGSDLVALDTAKATELTNGFCAAQKQLQIFSKSLLSVFSVYSSQGLSNSCGGEVALTKSPGAFQLDIIHYCSESSGQPLTINGQIKALVESGVNFTSDIALSIKGDGVDLTANGNSWDGRYNDFFFTMEVKDNVLGQSLLLDQVNIKKGELDLGYVVFPDFGRTKFLVIKHFNNDNTAGQIFFYGQNGEIVIVTAEDGLLSAVFKQNKLDPGILLDSDCNTI